MTALGFPRRSTSTVAAFALAGLTVVLLAGMFMVRRDDLAGAGATAFGLGVTAAVGAAVARRRPDHPCGWLLLGLPAVAAASAAGTDYVQSSLAGPRTLPATEWVGWMTTWMAVPAVPAGALLVLTFPTGRLPGRLWRAVALAVVVAAVMKAVSTALMPGALPIAPSLPNPLGLAGAAPMLGVLSSVADTVFTTVLLAALVSLVVRYRRARGEERDQMRMLAAAVPVAAAGLLGAMLAAGPLDEASFYFAVVGLTAIPLSIGWAVLRHGLFDIDVFINRAMVYGTLTVVVAGIYIALVAGLGRALQQSADLGVTVIATAVVAVGFAPLRERVQGAVDRMMYGARTDPYTALAHLGRRLEDAAAPEDALPLAVETLGRSLKLGAVRVQSLPPERRSDDAAVEVVASWGEGGRPEDVVSLELVHGRELVGGLEVWPRQGEALSPRDRRLLDDLCRPVAVVLHASVVERQLQASRQSLVTTREEERRRLRADLHDGLGPELAGVVLGIGAARNTVRADPASTEQLLADLQSHLRDAVGQVRSLVEGLAPAVDQLGLEGALREGTTRLTGAAGLEAEVEIGPLPPLPAAVEVAGYRIVMEAVTNVARHAGATTCTVRVATTPGALELEVCDDGRGLPATVVPGVGLSSMRQRAEELGGSCTIEPAAGRGTQVRARLPIT